MYKMRNNFAFFYEYNLERDLFQMPNIISSIPLSMYILKKTNHLFLRIGIGIEKRYN